MARCDICQKSGHVGYNVSHSKRHTKRRWFANVGNATIYENGNPRKVKICTRCLRSQYKTMMKG